MEGEPTLFRGVRARPARLVSATPLATRRDSGPLCVSRGRSASRNSDVRIQRIISGGQTGVDRAALDLALDLGIPVGGRCPKGRWAEDGEIPGLYPLQETATEDPAERTALNVRDADGTLIICIGKPAGGTALSRGVALESAKPCLMIDPIQLRGASAGKQIGDWLRAHRIAVLNIAGPRESEQPGIYTRSLSLLKCLLR